MSIVNDPQSEAWRTINDRGWPRPHMTPLLRTAVRSYLRLHTARCRAIPGAMAITWNTLEIAVKDLTEADFILRTWDHLYNTCEQLAARQRKTAMRR